MSFPGVLRASLFVASLFIIIAGLRAASRMLAPLCVALFLSCIVLAPYRYMRGRGLGRRLAAAITVGGTLVFGSSVTILIIYTVRSLAERGPVLWDRLVETTSSLLSRLESMGLPTNGQDLLESVNFETISTIGGSVSRVTLAAASVVLLTGFVMAELLALPEKLRDFLRHRPRTDEIITATVDRLLTYFRVKTATSAVTGVLAGTACALVGLDLPLLWGFIAFLLNYITTVGSLIAAILPLALSLATLEPSGTIILGAVYLAINVLIGGVIEPKLLGGSMNLSPLVVLLSLALWGWVLGPIGVLLAVPLTTLFKIVLEQTEQLGVVARVLGSRRDVEDDEPGDDEEPSPHREAV